MHALFLVICSSTFSVLATTKVYYWPKWWLYTYTIGYAYYLKLSK